MTDQLAALIVDEGRWLTASMGLAFLAVIVLLYRHRRSDVARRRRILAAMNLTVEGSVPVLYVIGVALAVPSCWLIVHARRVLGSDADHGRATLKLNASLAITLLALGFHNLPLAVPGFLNIGYYLHSGRMTGWAIVGVAVLANLGLFIASVIFLASGQSFEQFRATP